MRSAIAVIAVAAACAAYPGLGSTFPWACALLALLSAVAPGLHRDRCQSLCALGLWGCVIGLAGVLLLDRFEFRYVWIYSGADLPVYLKFGNTWGGDEGITLLLAAACASIGRRLALPVAVDFGAVIVASLSAMAGWMGPFARTPQDWLEKAPYQGMNAHLMKSWMLFHAPLIVVAFASTLMLAGPALAALRAEVENWPGAAVTLARRAWALLTAGIGFGMVWAFEDPSYGQIWHWDPVQTSVFIVWCLLSAHLHGIASGVRRSLPSSKFTSALGLLASCAVLMSLAITRNDVLASSHRYAGVTGWRIYAGLAVALALIGIITTKRSDAFAMTERRRSGAQAVLKATQIVFAIAAALALVVLSRAFVASEFGIARPEEAKPFLATLANWAQAREVLAVRQAYDRWEVDAGPMTIAMLAPMFSLGLMGAWFFARRISRRVAWIVLALAASLALVAGVIGGPIARGFSGRGVLSHSLASLLPMLDACVVAGGFLALSCLIWALSRALVARKSAPYIVAVGLIHTGIIVAVWGGILSMVLNSYSQKLVDTHSLEDVEVGGYRLKIRPLAPKPAADGGIGSTQGAMQSVADVSAIDETGTLLSGQVLYRHLRSDLPSYDGPVRQLCSILDFHYARFLDTPGYRLEPIVKHGLISDVQLWVAPSLVLQRSGFSSESVHAVSAPPVSPIVVRVFPFASLLWSGLILTCVGAAWLAWRPIRGPSEV